MFCEKQPLTFTTIDCPLVDNHGTTNVTSENKISVYQNPVSVGKKIQDFTFGAGLLILWLQIIWLFFRLCGFKWAVLREHAHIQC